MSESWYYQIMGETFGPFTQLEMYSKATAGDITPDAWVRNGVDGEWTTADHVIDQFKSAEPAAKKSNNPHLSGSDVAPNDQMDTTTSANGGSEDLRVMVNVTMMLLMVLGAILACAVSPYFWWLALFGLIGFLLTTDWAEVEESNRRKKATEEKERQKQKQEERERQLKIVCPHCHESGFVTAERVKLKKGISGGKATGALITAGWSVLFTGLSREEDARKLTCSNCGTEWHVQ